MSNFKDKNYNRKLGKNNGTVKERILAKEYRKRVNGAFGREKEEYRRVCVPGTTGEVYGGKDQ